MAKPKWLRGKYRWWILLTIIVGSVVAYYVPPIQPHVQLPAENLTHKPLFTIPGVGPIYLTNTLVALILVDLVLLAVVFAVQRAVKSGEMVPRGLSGVVEAILEYLYNLTESSTAKWTGVIFPFFATIFLMVLVANWMELIPGVDSIGSLEPVAGGHGYPIKEILPGVALWLKGTVKHGEGFQLVSWVRVVPTDLNFTVGLALVSVFMAQVLGFRALGLSYLSKFFRFRALVDPFKVFADPNEPRKMRRFFGAFSMGAIDFVVGLIELISEFAKIISFSFRLFGNIFAGSVMLFVMGTLLPMIQSVFLLFELFVGLIQAFIFGILTMLFMSLATQGHGGHEEQAHV